MSDTPAKPILLIVDDDRANLDSYRNGFARHPYEILACDSGQRAVETLRSRPVAVVLTDLKMPGVDGLEVVRAAAERQPSPVSIVLTAYGSIETAVEAMRRGALDYLTKPVHLLELRAKVEKAMELAAFRRGLRSAKPDTDEGFRFEGVVGVSAAMRTMMEQIRLVARSRASVLVEGESGTGKELVARAVHHNSPRADGPFVPIHCAALPETLLESELFGHEKGSFTGAEQKRMGQFESAQGGTVFLDELAEIPLSMQVKLLRVLEQREITRVGSSRPIPIDIRLVAATNKTLGEEVKAGRFREDLYYRLNVVRLLLPPLRERPEDIPLLVQHFLRELIRENRRPVLRLSPAALDVLVRHPWYGNIRELRNVVEQIVVFAQKELVETGDLPASMRLTGQRNGEADTAATGPARREEAAGGVAAPDVDVTLADLERRHILKTLERHQGNRTLTAIHLGISRRTLQRKLKDLGMDLGAEAD